MIVGFHAFFGLGAEGVKPPQVDVKTFDMDESTGTREFATVTITAREGGGRTDVLDLFFDDLDLVEGFAHEVLRQVKIRREDKKSRAEKIV